MMNNIIYPVCLVMVKFSLTFFYDRDLHLINVQAKYGNSQTSKELDICSLTIYLFACKRSYFLNNFGCLLNSENL